MVFALREPALKKATGQSLQEAVAEERMRLLQKMSSNISLTETGLRDNVDGPTASRHTAKASHIN